MTRRKRKLSRDYFTPTPQAAKDVELAQSHPDEVVAVLGPRLSEPRVQLIERAIQKRTHQLHVAVDGVHDPHNTAAIMRTADAYGIQNVHIIEGQKKFSSSMAVTQGAHKWVDVNVWSSADDFVAQMRQDGRRVLVAAMDGAEDVNQMRIEAPTVLVFGNEAMGISERMLALADGAFKIPMYGFVESFNVSVAAAIAISTLRRDGEGDMRPEQIDVLRARFYLRALRAGYDIVMLERERSQSVQ